MSAKKIIKFHSKAKEGSDERYLSNFTMPEKGIVIDDCVYKSVEHYYQSMKYKPEHRGMFKGMDAELKTGKAAKSAGCKGAMKKMVGYTLSDVKWKGPSLDNDQDYYCIRVMKKALWARFQQDKRFRDIVMQKNVQFDHYQKLRGAFRLNKIPDWGCYFDAKHTNSKRGINILGNLLNELNAYYGTIPSYFEVNGKLNWSGEAPNVAEKHWFKYPRNTYGEMRGKEENKQYLKCNYRVRDSDVIHPFKDASIILHA